MIFIDLNLDFGENVFDWVVSDDESMFCFVMSVNVFCGFYVGSFEGIWEILVFVVWGGVVIGVYFGYWDYENFGWMKVDIDLIILQGYVEY